MNGGAQNEQGQKKFRGQTVSRVMSSLAVPTALFGALIFIIIGSPTVYQITDKLIGSVIQNRLADSAGNPTRLGMVVHSIVFFGILYGFARLNRI